MRAARSLLVVPGGLLGLAHAPAWAVLPVVLVVAILGILVPQDSADRLALWKEILNRTGSSTRTGGAARRKRRGRKRR